jgi:hypothetical protein
MSQISSLSLQYVKAPVQAVVAGATYDPTSKIVAMAFVVEDAEPLSGDWVSSSWEQSGIPTIYLARCLVGPGGDITLAPGSYQVYVKIFDNPETPVLTSDTLIVT